MYSISIVPPISEDQSNHRALSGGTGRGVPSPTKGNRLLSQQHNELVAAVNFSGSGFAPTLFVDFDGCLCRYLRHIICVRGGKRQKEERRDNFRRKR